MGRPSPGWSSCTRHGSVLVSLLLLSVAICSSWRAAAQTQPPPPQTDPTEAAAVNAILGKLGLKAPPSWNVSGNPCSGAATDDTPLDDNPSFNPAIKCDCTDQNGTLCHVTRLKINALDAAGPIPEELRNLTHLIKLDFRRNSLTGPLPAWIGELTALKYITVGINALSGPVPKELGNLTDLVSLALGSNHFNDLLPDELGKLTKLQQLYIDSNDFSGPLPATLSQLTNLSTLWASDNNFTGQIPDYLGSLTNMTQLRLQGNSFQGPILRSLSNLIKLTSLRIGDIVNGSSSMAFVGNMTSLGDLVLRNSKISDTFASVEFSKFVNLTLLDLSFNNMTGQMPQSIFNLPSLSFLFLGKKSWNKQSRKKSSAAILAEKFKNLRYDLKRWKVGISKLKLLIQKCNQVILVLDDLEDKRPLFRPEFNFRMIVKLHLEDLLLAECKYWRKRCTIRWIKLGEDNTKFFHAMATERNRRNCISLLRGDAGEESSDHQVMAAMLWSSYKNRMGSSEGIQMQFDLFSLLKRVEGLDVLSRPFEIKEMDDVIKCMPSDRAPGPDGFSGLFLKKCWHIVKHDFYKLANDFYEGKISLDSINGSLITLVPKKPSPEEINDFRPISLTNTCLKFLTKLAANRLQDQILRCVHKNQYGFLKSRAIQDCLAWAYEYIYLCQLSKKPTLIIKLDFAKAFDTIEHEAILQILKHKGFDDKWISLMRAVLSSGTSSVLLNGVPGKQFICKRGVRQGDPLSPLLYVFGGDLLQSVVNDYLHQGILKFPIVTNDMDFPIVQYADDTILVLPAEMDQILALKELLGKFSLSTGLRVNYQKSVIVPINVPHDTTVLLAEAFGCQIGSMPFPYLGLPLGTTKPSIQDLLPVVECVERRLTATSVFLSQGQRVQLIKSALSSMPIYFLFSLKLQPGLIKPLDRILRQCLWRDKDGPKQSLAAWDMVCKPKKCGGLGIINFHKQNDALLLKHLHKFYNKAEVPWVQLVWHSYYADGVPHAQKLCGSFWWRDIMKLESNYRDISHVLPGDGNSFLFWSDKWKLADSWDSLCDRFPRLFSYALDDKLSAAVVYDTQYRTQLFHLPLSTQAYNEFCEMQNLLSDNPLSNEKDIWSYQWGETYKPASFYAHVHAHLQAPPVYNWLWKSSCTMNLKVFAWLLLSDRLNTRDLLQRRKWKVTEDKHCVLCVTRAYEDRFHLFFLCNFSQRVWNYLQVDWSLGNDIQAAVSAARRNFNQPFFMEVMIVACWNIWKQRNAKIFQHERPTFGRWRSSFIHDISLLQYRIKAKHKDRLLSWIVSLA